MFSPVWELVGEAVILRVRSQARSNSIWELVGEDLVQKASPFQKVQKVNPFFTPDTFYTLSYPVFLYTSLPE